jgi:hypothetical protein
MIKIEIANITRNTRVLHQFHIGRLSTMGNHEVFQGLIVGSINPTYVDNKVEGTKAYFRYLGDTYCATHPFRLLVTCEREPRFR